MKVFIALVCLAAVASAGLVTKKSLAVRTTCGPDETECPAGCCPEANWFCCPDNRYCAATADDCPSIKLPNLLPKKKMGPVCEGCPKQVVKKTTCGPDETECPKTTCGPDETECPAGCCPEANWFCCPDNRYCAATADDCPAKKIPTLPKKLSVVK